MNIVLYCFPFLLLLLLLLLRLLLAWDARFNYDSIKFNLKLVLLFVDVVVAVVLANRCNYELCCSTGGNNSNNNNNGRKETMSRNNCNCCCGCCGRHRPIRKQLCVFLLFFIFHISYFIFQISIFNLNNSSHVTVASTTYFDNRQRCLM